MFEFIGFFIFESLFIFPVVPPVGLIFELGIDDDGEGEFIGIGDAIFELFVM